MLVPVRVLILAGYDAVVSLFEDSFPAAVTKRMPTLAARRIALASLIHPLTDFLLFLVG